MLSGGPEAAEGGSASSNAWARRSALLFPNPASCAEAEPFLVLADLACHLPYTSTSPDIDRQPSRDQVLFTRASIDPEEALLPRQFQTLPNSNTPHVPRSREQAGRDSPKLKRTNGDAVISTPHPGRYGLTAAPGAAEPSDGANEPCKPTTTLRGAP